MKLPALWKYPMSFAYMPLFKAGGVQEGGHKFQCWCHTSDPVPMHVQNPDHEIITMTILGRNTCVYKEHGLTDVHISF